ncbi:uncharacterized protein At4g37920-like [Zingiber officinale]|uniref:Uncharacterized protein n=1 Tax=Zingiber officinale TaxID=94328 RepID=A0A8J5HLR5_ZINOF|nr:uncharacterized protein At4g37920-like [Zingiber officinale]KAG6530278.1 hypothetical protein ZIOFF_012501 [Zingiber officinale]
MSATKMLALGIPSPQRDAFRLLPRPSLASCKHAAVRLAPLATSSCSGALFPSTTTPHTDGDGSSSRRKLRRRYRRIPLRNCVATNSVTDNLEKQSEVEVANGYTMTQFCDKMIEFFMHEKPQTKDWRKILVFRDDWKKYRVNFFDRCQVRVDIENDPVMKQKLISFARKMKKIDHEVDNHMELLKEIQENPLDINAIVAQRRNEFTSDFFHHLNILQESLDSLEDRDGIARLGAKCLSAVSAYDNTIENSEILETAQSKFNDILNSPSLDEACEKVKSLAKANELDSSLILLINRTWAAAKNSTTIRNEVKDIMHHIYMATKKSIKSIAPHEIKLLKYLLNITDPEERFMALATAFSPGDERDVKATDVIYTTPKELHKWIKIMLDAYHLNKEETDLMEARKMSDPVVIQRLFVLKETIEVEYLGQPSDKQDQETD